MGYSRGSLPLRNEMSAEMCTSMCTSMMRITLSTHIGRSVQSHHHGLQSKGEVHQGIRGRSQITVHGVRSVSDPSVMK